MNDGRVAGRIERCSPVRPLPLSCWPERRAGVSALAVVRGAVALLLVAFGPACDGDRGRQGIVGVGRADGDAAPAHEPAGELPSETVAGADVGGGPDGAPTAETQTTDSDSCGVCVGGRTCSPSGECVCGALPECPADFVCAPDGTCRSEDGAGVFVPAGLFWMGCNEALSPPCWSFELPAFPKYVGAFVIDRTEVTAGAYATCIEEGACSPLWDSLPCPDDLLPDSAPEDLGGTIGQPGLEDRPANCVRPREAREFCSSLGKRLCTEAEWEMAARGSCDLTDGDCKTSMRTYPWGEGPPTCAEAWVSACAQEVQPVGLLPDDASPYGVLDMSGNAAEWVRDCWYDYPGVEAAEAPVQAVDPLCKAASSSHVVRGGSLYGAGIDATTTFRQPWLAPSPIIGFRCCYSVEP